ncbi:hypothetical protein [Geosporobacter ferrireducens]|uniref:Uncharacterized protein n=1 Tax=Geosporobacter ferrireducens TaxID=1424294 RepID=A0A1D8GFK7_9FIRM|nr:hypothetical protein [Geosporobacter ferrireducens]AOT69675.1 hypothetical protein Gferi_08835 [Geosporobacter ferrireducens]MTI54619.1 hypothetical protein [Geosporobacter ferrireducens]
MYSAIKGLLEAIADDAQIHGAGIFWWPSFIGHYPFLYSETYYLVDQDHWMKDWVNVKPP